MRRRSRAFVGSSWIALSSSGRPPRSFVVSAVRSSGLITSNSSFDRRYALDRADLARDLLLERVAKRAAGDRERDRDRHVAARDGDVADHVELGDGLAQLGVDHAPECGKDRRREKEPCARSVQPPRSSTPAPRCPRRRSASGPRDRAGSFRAPARRSPGSRTRARGRAAGRRRDRPGGTALRHATPSVRPAARWQKVIACAPMIRIRSVIGARWRRRSSTRSARVASSERNSSSSFGLPVSGCPFRNAPPPRIAVHSSPAAEVVHEPEHDVVHRLALRHRHGEREVRDRPLRVLGAVDRIDDDRDLPVAPDPDLLGDDADVGPVEMREHGALGRLVDRRRHVAALPAADRPLALLARRQLLELRPHVCGRGTAEVQPGLGHKGSRRRPEVSFG